MKSIIIVGAGPGLGLGVARKFGKEGYQVVLISRNAENLNKYKEELEQEDIVIATKVADAGDFNDFSIRFNKVIEKYGTPDVLFYNVGITTADEEVAISPEVLLDRYRADVAGAYNCISLIDTKEFSEKHGSILITGGGLAIEPYAGYLPLSMDKAALRAMVKALAPVLSEKDIFLGTVQVTGVIGSNDHFSPDRIAEEFFKLNDLREVNEIIY